MKRILITAAALICGMFFSLDWSKDRGVTVSFSPESAQAIIGRPATPRSVAGVARRTNRYARRTYRRAYRRGYYY
jgi:hypothetical protein